MESGGERYEYISALNAESEHINALAQLIESNLQGWSVEDVSELRQQRANAVKTQNLPYNND